MFKKDRESRELFDAIKNSEINKIFDGKCELFIELDNRTDIQLLMSPNQRSRIPMVPEFIVEYLKEHDVAITKKNYVCLYDFVTNVIVSKNPKIYINNLTGYGKKCINGKKHVSLDDCIDILYNCNFKRCKNTIKKIQLDKTSIIDIKKNVLQYQGFPFKTFFIEKGNDNWDAWIQASQIVKYFGYSNTTQVVNTYVNEVDRLTYSQLHEIISPEKLGDKKIIGSAIFINISGFYDLCSGSTKKCATKIKKWLNKDVLRRA